MTQNGVSGHTVMVAAFKELISQLESKKEFYQPQNDAISIENLRKRLKNAEDIIAEVNERSMIYRNFVNERQAAAEEVNTIVSRVSAAFLSSNPRKEALVDFRNLIKKFRGKRIGKLAVEPKEGSEIKLRSNVQTSYVDRISNLNAVIEFLELRSEYEPDFEELKTSSLRKLSEKNERYNESIYDTYANLSNAREKRNQILYFDSDSIHTLSLMVKNYVRSQFGMKDPFTRRINAIRIQKISRR